jgi:hypothetical protein
MEEMAARNGYTILTPLISLDTPGKATVQVVILADPVSSLARQVANHTHTQVGFMANSHEVSKFTPMVSRITQFGRFPLN